MPFTKTIAAKIFGLAVFLLLLTIALAGFLLWEVARSERYLEVVAHFDVPLTESVSRFHEFGLRRRLAFERWFGALNAARPNAEIIAEATTNYANFTDKLMAEITNAYTLMAAYPRHTAARETLAEVRTLVDQLAAAYPAIQLRQREVLELQRTGQQEQANQLINLLNDLQRTAQSQRELVVSKVAQLSAASAAGAARRQRHVLWLTVAATVSTVLLGLTVAALITTRLTRPVRSLVIALRDVQQGNLDVQLPVKTADEVGALTDSFNFFVQELRSKEQIKRTFGKYIDPRILEHVLLQAGTADTAGGRRAMTVLFADLVGFTSLSERLTPSLMVAVLNRHFGLQARAVQDHLGVVDKFIGDSVMAFWGPPFVQPEEHARLACRAALAQLAALAVLRRELPEITGLRKDAPVIDLRLGICTGEVVVGNIGSENTRSFTVIGDTVNLSSRLERANRVYGTQILIDENTAQSLGREFEVREVDAIAVKGKADATRIFQLLGVVGQVGNDALHLRDAYALALRAYRAKDWRAAEEEFRECLRLREDDCPSAILLKRVQELRQHAPSPDWNGVWHLEEK